MIVLEITWKWNPPPIACSQGLNFPPEEDNDDEFIGSWRCVATVTKSPTTPTPWNGFNIRRFDERHNLKFMLV